ncbi:MAG: nucleotidyltransferase family protein [Bacteroidota bacterium]
MEAIILAGGFGTRLQPLVSDIPKSMALINGRPFLEYQIDYLISQGIRKVVLSVGYKNEIIREHFKFHYKSVTIDYAIEEEPLGTGGGIRLAFWKVEDSRAFALNGDSLFRFDFETLLGLHLKRKADVTMALRKLKKTGRYGTVSLNRNRRITEFTEKKEKSAPGFINGGVYIIEKSFLMAPRFRGYFSIEKDCFGRYFKEAKMYGFPADGYFLDIGIPEDYLKAQNDFTQFKD